jgi:hypothetical protein
MKALKLKPAGWIAVAVFGVLLVGLLGTAYRSVWGGNRLEPVPTSVLVTATAAAEARREAAPTPTATATPVPDQEAAWETFLQVIYKCDALPDEGDDVALYPESLEALRAGIEELTTDEAWLEQCDIEFDCGGTPCWPRRLAEFGPRNLLCSDGICEAAVAVSAEAGLIYGWPGQEHPQIIRGEGKYVDQTPYRLIKGQVEYRPEEDRWIVTSMEITVLPEPPEDF